MPQPERLVALELFEVAFDVADGIHPATSRMCAHGLGTAAGIRNELRALSLAPRDRLMDQSIKKPGVRPGFLAEILFA